MQIRLPIPRGLVVDPFRMKTSVFALLVLLAACSGMRGAEPPGSVAEIRNLSKEAAARALPVRLRGVVTMAFPGERGGFVIDDGTAGIFVNRVRRDGAPDLLGALEVGTLVEMDGVTTDGRFARDVMAMGIRRMGKAELPAARPVRMEELLGGHLDCQRVRVRGVVQSVEHRPSAPSLRLMLAVPGGMKLPLMLMDISEEESRKLLDAEVEAEGVTTSFFNERGELIGVNVQVADVGAVRVVVSARAKEEIPLIPLDTLKPYSPHPHPLRRVKVHGTVTFAWDGAFYYIQNGDRAVKVSMRDATVLAPGDRVEILGYPEMKAYFAEITAAEVVKIGHGEVSPSVEVDRRTILRRWRPSDTFGGVDGRRVELDARLERTEETPEGTRRLFLSHHGATVTALLSPGTPSPRQLPAPGSRVKTTGICVVELNTRWPGEDWTVPEGFHLLVQSAADIRVLSNPPWWTPHRIWTALAAVAALAGATAIWVIQLRRQVQAQMETIRLQSSRETLAEERSRLAREFHDTLEQELTGVAIQLDAASDSLPAHPDHAVQALESAHTLLAYTRAEARRSIWDLRAMALQERGLFGALEWSARQLRGPDAPEIRLEQTGAPLPLGARLETHLLRIGMEGLTNAVKHSRAAAIHLTLEYGTGRVRLRVRDDGVGFHMPDTAASPQGHFGLRGMRERANQIGAVLEVKSEKGCGTEVTITVEAGAPA